MHAGEVCLERVIECLACERAGCVVRILICCDPRSKAAAVSEVDNVLGSAGLLAIERETRGLVGLTPPLSTARAGSWSRSASRRPGWPLVEQVWPRQAQQQEG